MGTPEAESVLEAAARVWGKRVRSAVEEALTRLRAAGAGK
jgi:hypothetical protein